MKTIGLIGGMSWESSLEYYRITNELIKERLGVPHSSKSLMYSVDFAEFEKLQHNGEWEVIASKMINIAKKLESSGAELVLICTNTMHKIAEDVQKNIKVPLLHIADATAEDIKAKQMTKVGLLGTKFTMEQDFYTGRLKEKHGIDVIIPEMTERKVIHNVIFKELISGIIKEESKVKFKEIIKNLKANGAEGVILGCTEIPLLIEDEDSELPIFNTTMLHAKKAVNLALE
ncbi:aspartate/glutamate racemase family protein [Orenia marismortui]|uniref:Aspartate racemase n=1 Tax=Orenia marismortui TaxID=46469 RepID=A0A4R8GS62_9FIRM|nr:aspartate/glutamate racemase family protein [Orenia marismortui]TDX44497.1 aspartate racemase [Orenia marismortui]